jgi:hypothetical protein
MEGTNLQTKKNFDCNATWAIHDGVTNFQKYTWHCDHAKEYLNFTETQNKKKDLKYFVCTLTAIFFLLCELYVTAVAAKYILRLFQAPRTSSCTTLKILAVDRWQRFAEPHSSNILIHGHGQTKCGRQFAWKE